MPKDRLYLVLGIWILLSPWILGFPGATVAKWSNVLTGLAITIVAAWSIFGKNKDTVLK